MNILVNDTDYACTGKPSLRDPVRFNLPDGQPDPAALGDVISLRDDSGTVLRDVAVADFSRWYVSGESLIGTNAPEPVETEPTEPEPAEVTDTDVLNAFLGVAT